MAINKKLNFVFNLKFGYKQISKVCIGLFLIWENWKLKEGKFINMLNNNEPSPFTITQSTSGDTSKSGELYYAFDDNTSTKLTLKASKWVFNGTSGYNSVDLKFGKTIRVVEWVVTGKCSHDNGQQYATLRLNDVSVGGWMSEFNGVKTISYADTELGYVEADGIRLHINRTVQNGGGTSEAYFKDVQITKWYEKENDKSASNTSTLDIATLDNFILR